MTAVYSRINKFFFQEEDYSTIGLIRILAAGVIFMSLVNDIPFLNDYYSSDGLLSGHTELMRSEYRFSLLDYFGSPYQIAILYAILILAALMLLLGIFTRFSGIITLILLASFHESNVFVLDSAETLMRLMIFYLILAPSGKCCSLDAIRKRKKLSPKRFKEWQRGPIWPRRLMQIQLAIVYLFAFLPKTGHTWKDGTAVYYFLANMHFARFDFHFLSNFMPLVRSMTYSALAIELLFPILIWFKSIRPYINISSILLQLSILISPNIIFFSLIMLVAHLSFIEPEVIDKAINRSKAVNRGIRKRTSDKLADIYKKYKKIGF